MFLSHKKNYFFKSLFVVVIICSYTHLSASSNQKSEFPAHSTGTLNFDVDFLQLDGAGDSTRTEFIYSVFLTNDGSIQPDVDHVTNLTIDLRIVSKSGNVIHKLIEEKSVSLNGSSDNYSTYFDLKKFTLAPDTLLFELKIEDSLMGTKGKVSQPFIVRKFENTFSLSGLYFSSHIQRGDGSSIFEKGGVMMLPNPARVFAADRKSVV